MARPRSAPTSLILVLTLAPALAGPPPTVAGVDDLAWIAGAWVGSVDEDAVEETWLAPAGGAMVGVFRWLKGGDVFLYELMSLEESGDGVLLRIKHFGPGLVGWEEKADSVVFDLVESEAGRAAFEERGDADEGTRLVYRRQDDGGLTVTFQETRGGEPAEIVFRYHRR